MKMLALNALSLHCLSLLFVLLSFSVPIYAQTNKIFQWQFANQAVGPMLGQCVPMGIVVKPYDLTNATGTSGVPPYYMLAFPVGGTPTTTYIGMDNSTLNYQVTHPVGSQLLLSVVDSTGSAGGIPPQLFRVVPGQTSQCATPAPSSPDFTISSNVTNFQNLNTCDPWGITVKGGVPPYNVTIAAVNSPVVTNVTMPFGTDVFTYINRADPGTQMIVGISDLTGRWASGTPIVNTTGSTDYSCIGLVSSSNTADEIAKQKADEDRQKHAQAAAKNAQKRRAIIIGVTIPLIFLLIFLALFVVWLIKRKKRLQEEQDRAPRKFEEAGGQVITINTLGNSTPTSPGIEKAAAFADMMASTASSRSASTSSAGLPSSHSPNEGSTGSPTSIRNSDSTGRPGFASFPAMSIRHERSVKAMEAARSPDSDYPDSSSTITRSTSAAPSTVPSTVIRSTSAAPSTVTRSTSATGGYMPQTSLQDDEESTIVEGEVYQHRDGGAVRELPPPYADRMSRNNTESTPATV